jgi:hypothetical protein
MAKPKSLVRVTFGNDDGGYCDLYFRVFMIIIVIYILEYL